jgi:hypothetical protein
VGSDLCALGYLLIRPLPRGSFFSAELLPDLLISASECLCPQFPGDYAVDWCSMTDEQRSEKFGSVGVQADHVAAAREWATRAFDEEFGWPGTFYSVDAARKARASFFPADLDIRLIGVALLMASLDLFLLETVAGFAPEGESGYHSVAKRRGEVEAGGRMLGFEPLSIEDHQVQHTWLCNQLEAHCARILGVRPNVSGLIQNFDDAQRCCDEISRDETGAEPGPWLPFAIFEYRPP